MIKERVSERKNSYLSAHYFCCNELHSGIITNLSSNDMYIKTKICFPCHSAFDVLIPSEKGILSVPVRISRIKKEGNNYVGLGLEIVGQTDKYLNFVNTLKFAYVR